MEKIRIVLVFLTVFATLSVSRVAKCELVVTLEPEHPVGNEELFVHVRSPMGPQCFPPDVVVSSEGNSILLKLMAADACGGENNVTERRYLVGSFQEGSYTLDVEFCALNPPPFPSGCNVIARLLFDVAGAAQAVSVSANSQYAMTLLFLAVLLISITTIERKNNESASGRS